MHRRFSFLALAAFVAGASAHAQDIEPRSYSNAPVGVNFLIAGYGFARGGVSLDPSLPVTNANVDTSSVVFAYARSIDFFGKSGKFDVILPYSRLAGSAVYVGQSVQRQVEGFNDARFRLSVNLYGAPALTASEFRNYRQDAIVGASLQIAVPSGQYDASRLLNLSANRWSFKPEIGVSKVRGPWTVELMASATFYTDNDRFYGDSVRSQEPVYAAQAHAIYSFSSGIWASFDAVYFVGGRSALDGVQKADLQQNWRVGATVAFPIDQRNSIKLYANSGVSARTGNDFDLLGIAWQYRWGGGL